MAQYLLSVYQPVGPAPAPEFLEPIMRDLEALNREMKAAGAWVFGAGPPSRRGPPLSCGSRAPTCSSLTVPSPKPRSTSAGSPSSKRPTSTPPLAGPASWPAPPPFPSKCDPSSIRHPGNGRATDARRTGRRSLPQGGPEADIARVFRQEYGRAVAVLTRMLGEHRRRRGRRPGCLHPRRPALAVHRAPAKPGRLDHHHGPEPGHGPAAPGSRTRRQAAQGRAAAGGSAPRQCRRPRNS